MTQEAKVGLASKITGKPGKTAADGPLTAREKSIVDCICRYYTNKEIAKELDITEETVKRHLSNIFDKQGVYSRTELAMRFAEQELQNQIREQEQRIQALEGELVSERELVELLKKRIKYLIGETDEVQVARVPAVLRTYGCADQPATR